MPSRLNFTPAPKKDERQALADRFFPIDQTMGIADYATSAPKVSVAPKKTAVSVVDATPMPAQTEMLDATSEEDLNASGDLLRRLFGGLGGALQVAGKGISGNAIRGDEVASSIAGVEQGIQQRNLNDPKSRESQIARDVAKSLYKKFGNDIPLRDDMTAAEFTKLNPYFAGIYNNALGEYRARQAATVASQKTPKNPFAKEIQETEVYRQNLNDKINKLKTLVKDYGNNPKRGTKSLEINQLASEIALDYNKMKDPGSIVRPEEAEAIKSLLGIGSTWTSNSTTEDALNAFQNQIDSTAQLKIKNLSRGEDYSGAEIWANRPPNAVGIAKASDGKSYYIDANKNPIKEVGT